MDGCLASLDWNLSQALPGALMPSPAKNQHNPPLVLRLELGQYTGFESRHGLFNTLSSSELERASRFRSDDDKHRFILGRGALRISLGQCLGMEPWRVPLGVGPHGKPTLAFPSSEAHLSRGLEFNLSHSHHLVLIALDWGHTVGVDVEWIPRRLEWKRIAMRYLDSTTVSELVALPPQEGQRQFLQHWCLLEARMKCRGSGLSGLDAIVNNKLISSESVSPEICWSIGGLPADYYAVVARSS